MIPRVKGVRPAGQYAIFEGQEYEAMVADFDAHTVMLATVASAPPGPEWTSHGREGIGQFRFTRVVDGGQLQKWETVGTSAVWMGYDLAVTSFTGDGVAEAYVDTDWHTAITELKPLLEESGIESSLVGPGDTRVTVPLSELHDLRETTVRDVFALNRKYGL